MAARLASSAAFCAVVALLSASCGGSAAPRPDLVFVSSRSGVYAIWEMNADGGRQRRLTGGRGDSSSPQGLFFQIDPAWSPDGTTIAYSSGGDIWVADRSGKSARRLTSGAADDKHPSFSPEGSRIAFQRGTRLWVMSADGSGAHRVTRDSAAERAPAWSPDGTWIAYSRDYTGTPVREIWLVHPDGSGARRLTKLAASANTPAWSPDGRKIAFSDDAGGEGFKLWQVGVDGTGAKRLTATGAQELDPAWAPQGGTIAFSSDGSIATMVIGENAQKTLTESENNDSSPAWNPVPAGKKL